MKTESTQMAVEIYAAGNDLATDLACKRVLALKDIMARILQRVVREYKPYTPEEIAERFLDDAQIQLFREVSSGFTNRKEFVSPENSESVVPNEGHVYFDVRVVALLPDEYRTKTQIFLHIDMEAQKEYRPGYPIEKRGLYYIARMLSSQIERVSEGSSYAGLQKVYSIWICLGKDIPVKEQQTITRFYLAKEDLVGQVDVREEDFDLLELILVRLGDKETEDQLLGMLTTLLWKKLSAQKRMQELEERYGVPMKHEVVEEVGNMCSYSAAIKERAMDEGREEGKALGRAEGRAQAICILLDSMGKVPTLVKEQILSETDEERLDTWLKLTRQVDTWQEFCELACIDMV